MIVHLKHNESITFAHAESAKHCVPIFYHLLANGHLLPYNGQ